MIHTIEDAIEILAGIRPRIINIRIDHNEKNLIKSIGRQVSNGIALTDRQLDLSLKKIKKYQGNLEKNNLDIETMLVTKPLRLPLREIDRSQRICFEKNEDGKSIILIKGTRSKIFQEKWAKIENSMIGEFVDKAMTREVPVSEINILNLVSEFSESDFTIDNDLMEIYQEIEKILENPDNFAPYIGLEENQVIVKNANKHCYQYIEENISDETKANFLSYIDKLKNCGIYHKNHEILEKIGNLASNELVKNILSNRSTRFRINSETYDCEKLIEVIDTLDQWPILVLVDEDHKAYDQVLAMHSALSKKISNQDMTVFFRVDKGHKNFNEFTQFVKDNNLNNYIGPNTKAVFIAKNKIPKPLLKAAWKPYAAVMMSQHDFGKTSAFLDDLSTVYYYNTSVVVRHNKIKGARQIAQL
jgi:hypothetical protein